MSATVPTRPAGPIRRPHRALRFTRDDELVRLLRAGDERAFEAMYDRHHRGILAFCRHMLGSREEAEDAVQHTFAAAHRNLIASDRPMQLKAWLYAIARNRCLSILRARREERSLEDAPEPSVEGLTAEVHRRQELQELLVDLQRLPDDQRAALVLAELGDLSHEEIAEAIGVRTGKVKALVFQARESLASSRTAREADCRDIQEQLAVLRGGALRRTTIRRHVEHCPACAAFKAEVQRQRSALAAVLPVAPTLALKEAVLGAAAAGGAGAAAAGGGAAALGGAAAAGGAGGAGGGLAAKVMTVAALAGGTAGGGAMVVDEIASDGPSGRAIAAQVPKEERAVELVGRLRERARVVGLERAEDRRTAARRSSPSGSTAPAAGKRREERGERPTAARATPDGRRGRLVPSGNAPRRRDGRLDAPAAGPAPVAAQEPASAHAPTRPPEAPASAGPKPKKDQGKGHEQGKGKGHDKAGGKHGEKWHGGAAGGRGDDDEDRDEGSHSGKGREEDDAPEAAAPPPTHGGRDDDGEQGKAKAEAQGQRGSRVKRDRPGRRPRLPSAPALPPAPPAPAPDGGGHGPDDDGDAGGGRDGAASPDPAAEPGQAKGRGPRAIVSAIADALTPRR